ncbi:hypothetical protein FHT40_006654 [Mycolicibacterium sp. BK556]|uniref:hypothetical protein n=1 Tax=Mycobacteriaceae TaxID=1762 RepID=UPI00141520D8|nr:MULTISPECIES: hypothetical protein [Mycobacteriaceae]MBB3606958.1 hypothetical protein [Mycolicibacterium sp. BK556]MBB3636715.1 hypothetical protein [Mycolicibacterium sp. BK607]
MISGRLIVTVGPPPAVRAYATIVAITSFIDRFGGVVGVSAAAKVVVVRALAACVTVGTDSVVASVAAAGVADTVVVPVRFPVVDFGEFVLEPPVAFDAVERPECPTLGPVALWLDDAESLPEESALAIPVAPPSEAQTPTVRAPAPSQNETLLCGCWPRWRAVVRCTRDIAR